MIKQPNEKSTDIIPNLQASEVISAVSFKYFS